ncbi:phage portal protein [Maritalea porphyrae]|uniref:phage portal protein n=1 Tax=Maritalea porphyrae TaxID=880732 RepID=UPI0022AF0C98|nr:phage portal protein [Maritalea porphyrae]MCZ4273999.1 phage portal protein [Maritalea porphyrae]
MNILENAIKVVSPGTALRRAQQRQALDIVTQSRGYDAASNGRRTNSFKGRSTDVNAEIGPALATLRNRSRDMCRNTPIGARIVQTMTSHLVGNGIKIIWDTGSDASDRRVGALYEEFESTSDIEGETNYAGQQVLAARSMVEGGEVFGKFVDLRLDDYRTVPFAIKLFEGDQVAAGFDNFSKHKDTRLGVKLGEWDQRLGYWLYPQHPGAADWRGANQPVLHDRESILHLYHGLRPGQLRGVPWMAPSLMTGRDLADLIDAMVTKTRVEACVTALVTGSDQGGGPENIGTTSKERPTDEKLAPGLIKYLPHGADVKVVSPSGTGQYETVWMTTMMMICAGAGVTYDQGTGDLRQANYSSLKAGKIELRRLVSQIQHVEFVPKFMARVTSRFLNRTQLAGLLPKRRDGYSHQYVMPVHEPIDPLKDLQADILAVRAGAMSPQKFFATYGVDWRKMLTEFKQFETATKDLDHDFAFDASKPTLKNNQITKEAVRHMDLSHLSSLLED